MMTNSYLMQQDKRGHVLVGIETGAAGMLGAYVLYNPVGWISHPTPFTLAVAAIGFAAIIGIFKEVVLDGMFKGGEKEAADAAATIFGGMTAWLLLEGAILAVDNPINAVMAYLGLVLLLVAWVGALFMYLMTLYNKFPKYRKLLYIPGAFTIVLDVMVNYLTSYLFWELPRYWNETLSARFGRYLNESKYKDGSIMNKLRNGAAKWVDTLTSRVDPGHLTKNWRT